MSAQLAHDLRSALRSFRNSPGFTLAALAILALAIGANAAVFSIADGMLLRPLPFGPGSERVVTLHAVHPAQAGDWDDLGMSWSDLEDVAREARTLRGVAGHVARNFTLSGGDGEAQRVRGGSVTPGLFDTLGTRPLLGRGFRAEEAAAPGFESVALLGYGLWQGRFGAAPDVVGRRILVNQRALEVIGVMPAGFGFPEVDELWVPFRPDAEPPRSQRYLTAVARLAEGHDLQQAREELAGIASRLGAIHPETNRDWSFAPLRFRDSVVSPGARALAVSLLSAVALVLLVGCANLASLLLARGSGRLREHAIRAALGASRARLVRQSLVESVLLALLGGALGALLAAWIVDAIGASFPEPLPFWFTIAVDLRTLLFVLAAALATGVGFGLVPALRGSRLDLVSALGEGGRSGGGGRSALRLQSALVVGQIAVSLGLLVGASLLARSFLRMTQADPGFDASRIASLRLYLAGDGFDPPEARVAFFDGLLERLRALPGVAAATATGSIPADDGGFGARVVAEAGALRERDELGAQGIVVTPDFFDAIGAPLLEGRSFEAEETRPGGPPVALVNRALAESLWPGERAVGRRLGLLGPEGPEWLRVIGVAPHVVYEEFGEETPQSRRNLYVPYARAGYRNMALLLRAEADPGPLLGEARAALREWAPGVPAWDYATLEQRRTRTTWAERIFSQLLASFAGLALLLVCTGVYGVTAVSAGQRVREVGIRLALGALRRDLLWLLLRRGLALAGAGLLLGLPLALGAGRVLSGALYSVDPFDPLSGAVLAGLLAGAVVLASYVPLRRLLDADPAFALRHD